MDYIFPPELFPSYFNSGPPKSEYCHNVGGWGVYGQVKEGNTIINQHGPGPAHTQFVSQHETQGEVWLPVGHLTLPLYPPKIGGQWLSAVSSDPLDFSEHMQNFYQHNSQDAFHTTVKILQKKSFKLSRTESLLESLKYKKCELTHIGYRTKAYHNLLSDVIYDIPPEILAENLYEELSLQRDLEQFSERSTGGALCYIPFPQLDNTQRGCLVYPGDPTLHSLNFDRIALEFRAGQPPCIDSSHQSSTFKLTGPVRQICTATPQETSYVGVRSDYMCGVWTISEKAKPKVSEVIQTKEIATCLSISPYIQGELLVASESGATHLWTVGKSQQKCRKEDSNLYFNAKSAWRWCDFSGHPRVMIYADRTGVELTDIRTDNNCSHTLFRIGQTPDCKTGERVIMSKYLQEVHTFHHLVTTQFSAYILDERFPCIPMVKWDHMMQDPPTFAHILAPSSSGPRATKILLGSQRPQELTLLQYSGGREHACCSRGPPTALLRPRDSLRHLPAQLPHHHHIAQQRLELQAAGLTCIQQNQGAEDICVLQMTKAGDIFYQGLRSQSASSPEDIPSPAQNSEDAARPTSAQRRSSSEALRRLSQDMPADWNESRGSPGSTSSGPTVKRWFGRRGTDSEGDDVVDDDGSKGTDLGQSEFELDYGQGIPSSPSRPAEAGTAGAVRPSQAKAEDDALLKWKTWLSFLVRTSDREKSFPHKTIPASGLLSTSVESRWRELLEEDKRDSLRRDVREAMKRGKVLVHGSTHLPPLEPVTVPKAVEPSAWTDDLSQRLTQSWEGGWKVWWEEKLGVNQESKQQALRRKRRRQKMSRGSRLELSGSFCSSVSYQSELDDLSDYTTAPSHCAASDSDGASCSWLSDDLSEMGSYKTSRTLRTAQANKEHLSSVLGSQEPSQEPSCGAVDDLLPSTSPATSSQTLRTAQANKEYLSSVLGSQEPSCGAVDDLLPSTPLATSSQSSSVFASQRTPRMGGSSQTSSQIKRKKSRLGF